ncbi:MAG: Gfo/Idh/MocA family oxidoreductase [Promethearchaeota archaeon]
MTEEKNEKILLIGAGTMAMDYAKVLKAMKKQFIVIGRGKKSAQDFEDTLGIPVEIGGINKWLENNQIIPDYAIVAVTGNQLGKVCISLLRKKVTNILLEKPGGLNEDEIKSVANETDKYNANVLLAYNRHFFASVIKAKEIIQEDGGVTSFNFEFTEWSHIVEKRDYDPEIKKFWLIHNSSHVIDLAFYLGGTPEKLECFTTGGFKWHPSSTIFTGAGMTKENVPFSYHSNWDAPGRWGVEILTKNHRLIFRPLEKLQIQKKASIAIEEVDIDYNLDTKFKPGLFKQVDAFLNKNWMEFIDIHQQLHHLKFYNMIANY